MQTNWKDIKACIKYVLKHRRREVYSLCEIGAYIIYVFVVVIAVCDFKCGGGEVRHADDTMYAVMSDAEYSAHFRRHILEAPNPRPETKFLIIHHAASDNIPTEEEVRNFQLSEGYPTICYHFLYDPEAKEVIQVMEDTDICPHAYSMNSNSVAICLLGNYETNRELDSVDILIISTWVDKMMNKFGLTPISVCGHGDCVVYNPKNNTACPGKNVDVNMFIPRKTEEEYEDAVTQWSLTHNFKFTEWRRGHIINECIDRQLNIAQLEQYLDEQKKEMMNELTNNKK